MYIFQKSLSGWKVHLGILSNKKGDVLTKVVRTSDGSQHDTDFWWCGGKEKEKGGKHLHHTKQEPVISLQATKFRQIVKVLCCDTQHNKTSCYCHF